LREIIVLKIGLALGIVVMLAGCAVAPGYGYGYAQPYDPYYGYAQSYDPYSGYAYDPGYLPVYGAIGIWGGGGCCGPYYRHWDGYHHGGDRLGWHGHGGRGWHGGGGHGGGHGH
jgi:hypothetical protein